MSTDNKASLRKAFNDGTLPPEKLGSFIQFVLKYRGYYVDNGSNRFPGPWRNDQGAAIADVLPYTKEYETGILIKQS